MESSPDRNGNSVKSVGMSNVAVQTQEGNGHDAYISQWDTENFVFIHQPGENHQADAYQTGEENFALIKQEGAENEGWVSPLGDQNHTE